jgi:molecular chaperone DnaJ
MDLNKNYYQILGVDKNVDEKTLKKTYRVLSKKHHPDRQGGNAETFAKISEAYDVLNGGDRVKYDTQSPHGKNYQPNPFGGFGGGFGRGGGSHFDDILNRFTRGGFGRSGFSHGGNNGREHFSETLDISLNIGDISLVDLFNNPSKTFTYKRKVPCSLCDARGVVESEESVECLTCNSTGRIYGQICSQCGGSGKIHTKRCDRCNGEKVSVKDEVITVKLYDPNEKVIKYDGLGHFSKYHRGSKGDLHIHTNVLKHPEYEINGYDLIKKVPLDIKTAVFGGSVVIEHLEKDEDGNVKKFKFNIPPKTKSNEKFKLKNMGLASDKAGNVRGNLWVVLELDIDFDSLTDSDMKLISKLELNNSVVGTK